MSLPFVRTALYLWKQFRVLPLGLGSSIGANETRQKNQMSNFLLRLEVLFLIPDAHTWTYFHGDSSQWTERRSAGKITVKAKWGKDRGILHNNEINRSSFHYQHTESQIDAKWKRDTYGRYFVPWLTEGWSAADYCFSVATGKCMVQKLDWKLPSFFSSLGKSTENIVMCFTVVFQNRDVISSPLRGTACQLVKRKYTQLLLSVYITAVCTSVSNPPSMSLLVHFT